ncbi:3-keto-5-aminohexanoate cleavage protein [bacterium (Candidatus Blackallbacteria) CG17_big_fil_post_rev_8_21_14_2_50_48_46]|uniref:3-keto-5-aminohexanoate cleavage protein n=1 Tax=bacterium (Candidatus Blackallbacteria) CG17_big_fil_post_rev_8_21_14_2_50_48_46 TaxID=2014261 RepID=A0A2M7G878_9BACT|nr:MAG: 3-keto-5-aminohexanoate cleavage protein [bacterium (Candidatus Blackallbacteria) CG18_big_fil_WC_8_21_14_2_50_49_26]PIW18296.1 MAG: 3-keto-5-aminohexanoate cleavage protein [bacterium (Candidatus Blackallbacteria) CG17_big_fil_post_rev_8_21_14_2_50_48_46]PIW49520.1 MAG: 3-keto-5-aminohexanoate cleavage protein [bacterium (Candidatus Blackallbacteria) CG13_big_fil_rev_8_21_14_2_50_49_14]
MQKAILTCALTGVLTDPHRHAVPVTPAEMAEAAYQAWNAGASIVHCHFRDQRPGKGALPTWNPEVVAEICQAIRERVPDLILNLSTGIAGPDISGPLACLERVKPEMAALNSGSLNYLKTRADGQWAWPPLLFDNPVEKVKAFLDTMRSLGTLPECECFDTGILRSLSMFLENGMLTPPFSVSLVMGVASGMPADPRWLPLLRELVPADAPWQVIAIGREEVWPMHRAAAEQGGNLRTGLEDTFYLPEGQKTDSNGALIAALARVAEMAGRSVASPAEARQILGLY